VRCRCCDYKLAWYYINVLLMMLAGAILVYNVLAVLTLEE
jgi:hypothetical protein